MSATTALAWKEWRQIRRDVLVLSALGVACLVVMRICATITGREAWSLVGLVSVACFLIPGAAIMLGASTTAGDGALSFAGALPASGAQRAGTRLGLRLVGLVVVAVTSAATAVVTVGSRLVDEAEGWATGEGEASVIVVLIGCAACALAASALASAFVARPLAAAMGGTLVLVATGALTIWLLGEHSDDATGLAVAIWFATPTLLAMAAVATARRVSERPLGLRTGSAILVPGLAVPALLVGTWALAAPGVARWHARSIHADLGRQFSSLDTWPERHRASDANAAALALEETAAAAGVDLVPWRRQKGNERRSHAADARAMKPVVDWLADQLASPSATVRTPPETVTALLAQRSDALADVRRLLLTGEMPRWESSGGASWDDVMPNLAGHMALSRWLLADALASVAAARPEVAAADVDAALRLAESLRDRGELVSQLVVMSRVSAIAAAARKLPAIPTGLVERLASMDVRSGAADGVEGEALAMLVVAERGENALPPWDTYSRLERWLVDPLARWQLASTARQQAGGAAAVRSGRCGAGPGPGVDAGNVVFVARVPLDRLDRAVAQVELTSKLAELQAARDAGGAWPGAMPGIEESRCEGLSWRYSGGAVVRLEAMGPIAKSIADRDAEGAVPRPPALAYTSP